jgi:aryl-alcohol dehydrogenase-like predicted oxidoreductase
MKKIEIFPGINASNLGFGCASILGAVDANKSKRAIECAIDNGINYFDIARSYGYGEAESFLGQIIKNKRNDLVIASKFGIESSLVANSLNFIKPLYRFLKSNNNNNKFERTTPDIDTLVNNKIKNNLNSLLLKRIKFNPNNFKLNFEKSLLNLRTNYLDIYFLHEPIKSIENVEEIIEIANLLKKEGKLRALGLAMFSDQFDLHKSYLDIFDILQFNAPINDSDFYTKRKQLSNVMFSAAKSYPNLKEYKNKLELLKFEFPKSIILSSMFNEKHIIENALLFR